MNFSSGITPGCQANSKRFSTVSEKAQASAHHLAGSLTSLSITRTAPVEIPIDHSAVLLDLEEYGVVELSLGHSL